MLFALLFITAIKSYVHSDCVKVLITLLNIGSEYDYPDFSISLTAYDCMARDNNFKLLAHIDSCWLKPEEFSKLDWTEADAALIKLLWK